MGLSWVSDDLSGALSPRPPGDHRARRRPAPRRRTGLTRTGLALAHLTILAASRLTGAYPPARPSPHSAFRRYWV